MISQLSRVENKIHAMLFSTYTDWLVEIPKRRVQEFWEKVKVQLRYPCYLDLVIGVDNAKMTIYTRTSSIHFRVNDENLIQDRQSERNLAVTRKSSNR